MIADGARFVELVTAPKGEPANPMTTAEFKRKFDAVVGTRLTPNEVANLDRALVALENGDLRPLMATLATPLSNFGRAKTETSLAMAGA